MAFFPAPEPSPRCVLPVLALVLALAPGLEAAPHPSLGDRRTPVSEVPAFLPDLTESLWDRTLAEVKAQPTDPAENDLPVPGYQNPSSLPLDEVTPDELESFRLAGHANRAVEVLMVLDSSTADEAQHMFEMVKEIHDIEAARGVPDEERLRIRFVLSGSSDLHRLELTAEEYEKYVIVDRYYRTSDVWMQDWGELAVGRRVGSDHDELVVFDSRRGRGLGNFPATVAREFPGLFLRGPEAHGKGNYGGNIEVTPDDVLVIGDSSTQSIRDMFGELGYAGRTVVLESSWLRVGHVDEYLVTLPAPDTDAGYVILKADATLALQMIRDIPAERWPESLRGMVHAAFRPYPRFPGVVGSQWGVREEFSDLEALRQAMTGGTSRLRDRGARLLDENRQAAEIVDRNAAKLVAELKQLNGGVEVPVISLPGLFTDDWGFRALLPGVANLVVVEDRLMIPDPLLPEFRQDVREKMEALGYVPRFVPNLTYHYMNGEIHCGSIVRRHPGRFVHPRYRRGLVGTPQVH